MRASDPDNGTAARQAPRPAGSTAPKDAQYFWDTEDAQVAMSRLRSLQAAKDKAEEDLTKARAELHQAQRRAKEAGDNLRAEINRDLRPKIAYPPRAESPPVDAAAARNQADFAPPPEAPPQKKERKPRKPREVAPEPMTGPMSELQMVWFVGLRAHAGCRIVPDLVAAALVSRDLALACTCDQCVKQGLARYVYRTPGRIWVVEEMAPVPGVPPELATGPWRVRSTADSAWHDGDPEALYRTVERARMRIEELCGQPDFGKPVAEPVKPPPAAKAKRRKGKPAAAPDAEGATS